MQAPGGLGIIGRLMSYAVKYMQTTIVIIILAGSILGVFLIDEKAVLLNFYYVPVLVAAYFLGKRHAVMAAIFCVLATIFYTIL